MNSVLVKICGIRTQNEAIMISKLGADFIGVLVDIPNTELSVNIETASKIVKATNTKTILLTILKSPEAIIQMINKTNPWGIQLLRSSPELVFDLKKKTSVKVIPVVHIEDKFAINSSDLYTNADFILADTKKGTLLGGTGVTHDWEITKELVANSKIPVILAGGLNVKNVRLAINKVHPFAVDVESGMRDKKLFRDLTKVKEFINAVKN